MIKRSTAKLIDLAEVIWQETPKDTIGYMARAMVQASMPYRDPGVAQFSRKNGNLMLTLTALDPDIGLPFGAIPRLMLAWLGREAVITQNPHINLGDNLASFLRELNLYRSGGARGDITRLKEQIRRLFSAAISISYADASRAGGKNLLIAEDYQLWLDYNVDYKNSSMRSRVTLSQPFFEELIKSPIPLDIRVFKALKSSPMSIDIYSWLSHRYSYLHKPSPPIPWESLKIQFGADYARTRDFKSGFIEALQKVKIVYPTAKYSISGVGLQLYPCHPHISKR